jgi:hypothetical protein
MKNADKYWTIVINLLSINQISSNQILLPLLRRTGELAKTSRQGELFIDLSGPKHN